MPPSTDEGPAAGAGPLSTADRRPPASSGTEVCIGVPVHNGGKFLPEALDCLLAQTHRDFQVVVLDDASTDGSDRVIAEYAARDPRLHPHQNPKRSGLIGAWRRAA